MKKIIILFSLIIVAIIINSCKGDSRQAEIDYAVVYPNADAVYLAVNKEYTLNKDGSVNYHYSHQLKLLTHLAFNRLYGESFIVYNPKQQELKINKSETVMADGKQVPSPENAFNEVLPKSAANAPAYNHLREMVVTHTGLEVGATINLDYEISSKSGYFPALMGHDFFQTKSPVKELNIIINIPKETELNYSLLNDSSTITITDNGEYTSYKLHIEDINALPGEDNIAYGKLPQLIFSTETFSGIFKHIKQQFSFPEAFITEIKKEMPELESGTNADLQKIIKIQKYVVNNINHYHLNLKNTGYKNRTPEEVWKENGGTTLEKTILLVNLLNNNGINATLTGTVENDLFNENIGVFELIDAYYVKVKLAEEVHYISAVSISDNNPVNKKIIQINTDVNAEKISSDLPNQIELNGDINIINERYITGTINGYFTNNLVPYRALLSDKNTKNSMITGVDINQSTIEENKLNELKVNYRINMNKYITNQANYYFINLPVSSKGVDSWHINYMLSERETSYKIPEIMTEEYNYTLSLPKNLSMVSKSVSIEKSNSVGDLIINITPAEKNEFIVHRKIKFKTSLINVENYEELKELMDAWNNDNYRQIIFKK